MKNRKISEQPEKWQIIKISHLGDGNTYYKVFASWTDDNLSNERWKMNSGITKVEEDEDNFYFYGESGSCYACHKKRYGIITSFAHQVLENTKKAAKKLNIMLDVMSKDTDWMNLLK